MSNEIYVAESSTGVLGVYTVLELALINHNVPGVTISKNFKKDEHQYKKIKTTWKRNECGWKYTNNSEECSGFVAYDKTDAKKGICINSKGVYFNDGNGAWIDILKSVK